MVNSKWKINSFTEKSKMIHRRNLITIIILLFLFTSCSKIASTPTLHNIEYTLTPTVFIETTHTPTISPTFIFTPIPTTFAQATIAFFDSLCIGAKEVYKPEISPNGEWLAAQCYWENENEDSPLQVSRLDGTKTWKIYYRQYNQGGYFTDRKDGVLPYRWSQDEKYLYAFTGQRFSGCCWKGLRYVFLIRLNLETGEQIPLLNSNSDYAFDFIISDSDRYLIFTPPPNQPYDFAILDMKTWETKQIFMKFPYNIDIYYAMMSPNEDKIILPLFQHIEFNEYFVSAIALIDLKTGEQQLIVSDLDKDKELYPLDWIDEFHVLVTTKTPGVRYEGRNYLLLDIRTGQLEETEKPQ